MAKKKDKTKSEDEVEGADAVEATPAKRDLRLADHPRAIGQIRTVRSWCALLAFLAVGLWSQKSGVALEATLTRALEAGLIGYLVAWAGMVMIWRQLAQAEIETARRRIVAAMLELEAAEGGPEGRVA